MFWEFYKLTNWKFQSFCTLTETCTRASLFVCVAVSTSLDKYRFNISSPLKPCRRLTRIPDTVCWLPANQSLLEPLNARQFNKFHFHVFYMTRTTDPRLSRQTLQPQRHGDVYHFDKIHIHRHDAEGFEPLNPSTRTGCSTVNCGSFDSQTRATTSFMFSNIWFYFKSNSVTTFGSDGHFFTDVESTFKNWNLTRIFCNQWPSWPMVTTAAQSIDLLTISFHIYRMKI